MLKPNLFAFDSLAVSGSRVVPPIFIFQTDDDTVVPAENAVNFYLACRKHHVPAELHIYKPSPLGVGLMQGDPVLGT